MCNSRITTVGSQDLNRLISLAFSESSDIRLGVAKNLCLLLTPPTVAHLTMGQLVLSALSQLSLSPEQEVREYGSKGNKVDCSQLT